MFFNVTILASRILSWIPIFLHNILTPGLTDYLNLLEPVWPHLNNFWLVVLLQKLFRVGAVEEEDVHN